MPDRHRPGSRDHLRRIGTGTRFGDGDPNGFSTLVTEKPQLPMDQVKKPSDASDAHEYGAWTFVA